MRGQSTFIDLKDNAKEKQSEILSQGKQPEKVNNQINQSGVPLLHSI